jgi:hypothetical protein
MSHEVLSENQRLEKFVQLSSTLTGYGPNTLWGTGLAQNYYDFVVKNVSDGVMAGLLNYADDADQVFNDNTLFGDHPLWNYARAVIKLWYLGQWTVGKVPSGQVALPVSAETFVEALAWRSMGGHTQGAKQQGYGSWTKPPTGMGEE